MTAVDTTGDLIAPIVESVRDDRAIVKLIRADLYHGQPCGSGGEPYRCIALIGYYECVHA